MCVEYRIRQMYVASRHWGSSLCLNEGLVSFSKIMFLKLVSVFLKQEDAIQKEGHVRWGEGFVLVYDITDRGSFEEVLPLKNLLDEVKKPKNVTLILVGNKADLDHSRQVSTEEGEKLATELACAFYECSACTGEGNIMEAFYELCREVRRRKMVQGKTRRRSSTTHVKQAINKMLTKISS